MRVGSHLSAAETERILRGLYTWKDIFLDDVRQLEATDLVQHSIPTREGTRPYRAREPLYTPREVEWQLSNIPKMLEAGVITYTSSPWSAKSRFVLKSSGDLRPVHQFCALNDATIKSNYPMRRVLSSFEGLLPTSTTDESWNHDGRVPIVSRMWRIADAPADLLTSVLERWYECVIPGLKNAVTSTI